MLNERQQTVLALIAKGKTNPEIAESLGMTLDGAKWNVSEILGMTRDDEPGRLELLGEMALDEVLALAERELQRPIPAPPGVLGTSGRLRDVAVTVRNPAADGLPVLPEVEFYWRDEGN
ncbi:MAG: LuxR C-terminal-related transcriptional regulator [Dehalococcoidia bacterium]|nr:LuxR C-terminal-related transcriptional regulator [Dehalococcoidia bacterium]